MQKWAETCTELDQGYNCQIKFKLLEFLRINTSHIDQYVTCNMLKFFIWTLMLIILCTSRFQIENENISEWDKKKRDKEV